MAMLADSSAISVRSRSKNVKQELKKFIEVAIIEPTSFVTLLKHHNARNNAQKLILAVINVDLSAIKTALLDLVVYM